jgi:signal transduction histidine kinase
VDDAGPDPDVTDALRQLRLGSTPERLAAARLLVARATVSEIDALVRARRREMDHYVQRAIDEAIAEAPERPARMPPPKDRSDEGLVHQPPDDEAYARALRATTTSLVHELRRPLGLARLAAGHGDVHTTSTYLDRMDRLLDAMEHLVTLAAGGISTEFDLGALVEEVAAEQQDRFGVPVELLDRSSITVSGNRGAVELIVRNGVANACESTQQLGLESARAVAVSFGRTDRDAWTAVLDHGGGVEGGFDPFTFAATRKPDHDGVGLALARQAAKALRGTISLTQRVDGGATLRLTWPQTEP